MKVCRKVDIDAIREDFKAETAKRTLRRPDLWTDLEMMAGYNVVLIMRSSTRTLPSNMILCRTSSRAHKFSFSRVTVYVLTDGNLTANLQ